MGTLDQDSEWTNLTFNTACYKITIIRPVCHYSTTKKSTRASNLISWRNQSMIYWYTGSKVSANISINILFNSLLRLGDKDITSITQSPQVVQIPIGFETGSDDRTSFDSDSDFTPTSSDDISHDLHTHTGSNLSQPERKWCLIDLSN